MVIKNPALSGAWLAAPLAVLPVAGECAYGAYTHGTGIKSLGFAGIAIVLAEDTYTISLNPANVAALGRRTDFGMDIEFNAAEGTIRGNLLGTEDTFRSQMQTFFIPMAGAAFPLSDTLSMGFTGFFAGFGADYPESPYERFGGDDHAALLLGQFGVSSAIAWTPVPAQSLGVSLNLSYQSVDVKGVDAFARYSSDPDHLTNQGADPCLGYGFTLGWHGYLTNWLAAGASFRSKTWTQRSSEYAGLLPDRGTLDLPAMFGAGLSWMPHPRATVAVEFQRVLYEHQRATGNPGASAIRAGRRLGEKEGPGFGWKDQDIVRIGVAWKATPSLDLRGGFAHGTDNMPAEETLLGPLAPSFANDHFTLGATWSFRDHWEASGYVGYSPKKTLRGENSIPLLAGGGEMDLVNEQAYTGFSFARRFDR